MVRLKGSLDEVRRKYKNSFARQYLDDNNIQFYAGQEQILTPIGQLYKIKLPNTRFYVGEQFSEEGDIRKITSYQALYDLGFVVVSAPVTEKQKWEKGQKVVYMLVKASDTSDHLKKIPVEHYVEHDKTNRGVCLIGPRAGPNDRGVWVMMDSDYDSERGDGSATIRNIMNDPEKYLQKQILNWQGLDEKPKPVHIKELPFMISDANELVCFPMLQDMPSILITGMRGSGKCVIQDTKMDFVLDPLGRCKKIEDKPKQVLTLNKNLKLEASNVKEYFNRTVNKVIELKTRYGKKILLTPEHPLLTIKGWEETGKLKPGDYIATPKKYNLNLDKEIDPTKLSLISYAVSCGVMNRNYLQFHQFKRHIGIDQDIKNKLNNFDKNLRYCKSGRITLRDKSQTHTLRMLIKSIGLDNLKKNEMFVPDIIMQLSNRQIANFLSIYFTIRGHTMVKSNTTKITLTCSSETISRQLQHLLLRFGIASTVSQRTKRYKDNYIQYSNLVSINNSEGVRIFSNIISPYSKYKSVGVIENSEHAKKLKVGSSYDIFPSEIWKIAAVNNWKEIEKLLGYTPKGLSITRANLKRIANISNNPILNRWVDSDILWDKITSIEEKTGEFKAWDIEVDNPMHNFIANDIIIHNSFALHSLVSRLYWKPGYSYKIAILNDSSRETGTWNQPNKDEAQRLTLKKLNERPLPLPCVYFHPQTKETYEKLFMGDIGFDIAIPFKEVVNKHKKYLNLKDSARYFSKIKEELLDCKSEEEAAAMFERMQFSGAKIPPQTMNKIMAEFEMLFDSKMTDISSKTPQKWITSLDMNSKYNPFTAAISAGLIPVLESEYLSSQLEILAIYFSYFVGDLFERQKQDLNFVRQKSELLLVVDEAHNVSGKSAPYKSPADLLLRRSVKEGRPRRIGTIIATQMFGEMPEVITGNTTFLLCFKNPQEATMIAKRYNMGTHIADQIKDLDKHQCIAYTSDHFIIYDSTGRKRRSNLNEVFVGKSLPPYSMHKKPKASGGEK